ncbi:MAG: 2Fe-2S iron-sulfur cluster binding domain-containing protein [Acidiferrobacterales bacterium]|nr:2Fe-2S iron-sulfur cluster binding domain-containing protein [Acidiferrobacterales bacterium]
MKVEIEKKDQHFSFVAQPGEKFLYAGLRAGVPLPYECATGTCGTCRARLKGGEINTGWKDAPGKSTLKADRQEFLLCQAYADDEKEMNSGRCTLGVPSAIKAFRDDDITPAYFQGEIQNWSRLTGDVAQFDVLVDSTVEFHAGQFFVLDTPGIDGYRAYSMVNYAPETNRLTFIVKNKPGGAFSEWAFHSARLQSTTSDRIALFGPLGRATFHPDEGQDLFMVAGGSGIAGLLSILRHAADSGHLEKNKAELYFGVRTADDVFFVSELNAIKDQFPNNVELNIVFSDQQQLSDPAPELGGMVPKFGFVHEQALANIEPGATNTMVYLAGPPPMVDALIRPLIIEAKVPVSKIRYDKFG